MAVRPEGANHQWRKNPPGELSIDPVADERLVGNRTGWSLVTGAAITSTQTASRRWGSRATGWAQSSLSTPDRLAESRMTSSQS
jgi:hypothetical protein